MHCLLLQLCNLIKENLDILLIRYHHFVFFKECGADCVKLQKSCLKEKFTTSALSRTYDGPNSWGKTYGEHKEHLEFDLKQIKELQEYAEKIIGIPFTASAMDWVKEFL